MIATQRFRCQHKRSVLPRAQPGQVHKMTQLLKVEPAADELSLTAATVYASMTRPKLAGVNRSLAVRIPADALDEVIGCHKISAWESLRARG